jgi:dTDP-4-dehydrorhamnose 3,5-epimerase
MKFIKTNIKNLFIIQLNQFKDNRGEFKRIFCSNLFKLNKLNKFVQVNHSINKHKGTLRGFHLQTGKFAEDKLVYCIKGAIWDCVIDLRKKSKTYLKVFGIKLDENSNKMLYVPRGFAHSFLTLKDLSEVIYFSSNFYDPASESGIRYNDKKFKIKWPIKPRIVSEKDQNFSDFIS